LASLITVCYCSPVVGVPTVTGTGTPVHSVADAVVYVCEAHIVSTAVQCPPDYCQCSSFEFLLMLLSLILLASLLHVAGYFTDADTDSGDLDAVDIHDVPIVPPVATVLSSPDVKGVSEGYCWLH
jgi:hypothetical protein